MKKIITLILALAILAPVAVSAQSKAEEKARQKEVKTKIKEFTKKGWTLYGSSRSLEVVLTQHYAKLDNQDLACYEIVGTCSHFKSKNIGHQTCINNAAIIYAQSAGRKVKGMINNDLGFTGKAKEEFEHFYAAYESQVLSEINGELQESFSVIHEIGKGEYEMETYFIVNKEAASQARRRAYENAIKESEAAQKYAETISKYINENFNPNEID